MGNKFIESEAHTLHHAFLNRAVLSQHNFNLINVKLSSACRNLFSNLRREIRNTPHCTTSAIIDPQSEYFLFSRCSISTNVDRYGSNMLVRYVSVLTCVCGATCSKFAPDTDCPNARALKLPAAPTRKHRNRAADYLTTVTYRFIHFPVPRFRKVNSQNTCNANDRNGVICTSPSI
jgi:hypothetical protein